MLSYSVPTLLQFPIFAACTALGVSLAGAADMIDVPAAVAKQLRKHHISLEDVSLYVHNVAEPAPRVAVNEKVPRNPASTIKALTTKAGLDMLGPTHTWRTEAHVTGTLKDGRLDGDLIIKGYGDPSITPEALWRLLWGVRERGIETVAGDVILDSSYFAPPESQRGDFDGKENSAYNALPAALSVNFQTTQIHLFQDPSDNSVRVFTDPPLANVEVKNRLRVVKAPCKRKYHKPAVRVTEKGAQATLDVTGTFATECGEASYPRLMLDPAEHTAGALVALWRGMGGRIVGAVREGTLPKGANRLYRLHSPLLVEVIRRINKRSNNLMSRSLFLTLGARREGAPGSLPKARKAVSDWLGENGLDFPDLVLDNGSGLSRDTRISAESMGRLLGYAYASPTMAEFMSSLSIAGVDGTMRKRFKRSALKGRAHVKTGTIRGTTGIAGYVLDKAGRRWVVVSLMNNPHLQTWRGKAVENALLQWVYEGAGDKIDDNSRTASQLSVDSPPVAWFLNPTVSAP